jgi:hypothetical protein
MALDFTVNLWAVLVMAIASIVIGWTWYSPLLFGNRWIKIMGWSKKDLEKGQKDMNMGKEMGRMFAFSLIMSFATAVVFDSVDVVSIGNGILLGLVLALGLVATTSASPSQWEKRPWGAYWIYVSFAVAWFVLAGIVFTTWV